MNKLFFSFFVLAALCSCAGERGQDSGSAGETVNREEDGAPAERPDSMRGEVSVNPPPPVVPKVNAGAGTEGREAIRFKIFHGENGYGYDIIMDGHPYVHQPNIPALPGNRGFETEADAIKVAQLVVSKILNHVMPPTVGVNELDSLGIR
jgi:hypothetical protein